MLALAVVLGAAAVVWAARPGKRHLLVVNFTAGFHHSSIAVSQKVIKELGERTGLWDVDFASNEEEVRTKLTEEGLKKYDAVFFDNTTGELPISEEGKAAFLRWLRGGKGFIGTHAATDTFYRWPEYGKMLGGYFNGHPWTQTITVRVEDRHHPACRDLLVSFQINDEIYQFRDWTRSDKRVLLSIDNASIDTSKGAREDRDYAVAWVRMEGKGRVFYTSLGHREEVWQNPLFQKHLTGGIQWALGLVKGDARPVPRKP